MAKEKTVSLTSPKGGKRGCKCDDGKYRHECCDGTLQNQGFGSDQGHTISNVTVIDSTRTIVNSRG